MSLLPLNSTKFERDVEKAITCNVVAEALHGFKFKTAYGAAGSDSIIGSSVTLALDWEYSLAQVNIDDFMERVLKGLEFHRLRGTPAALRNALSWHGFDNIIIEEEPLGEHFAEFQIGIEEIPNGFVPDPIIAVAACATPLRSRLSRMYNKLYDERCLFLDNSLLDEGVLSDDSGIRLLENGPKLSFGRVNNRAIEIPLPVVSVAALRNHFAAAKNFDTWRLDFATFDDLPSDAINRKATAERERTVFNTNPLGKIPADLFKPRRFSKSSIVLSENATFDDLNTAFSGGYDEVEETPFILSFSPLSGSKTTIRRILIDEYFLREKVFYAINEFEPNILNEIRERERSIALECDFNVISGAERNRFVAAEYKGSDIWQDQKHFDVSWNQQSFFTKMA